MKVQSRCDIAFRGILVFLGFFFCRDCFGKQKRHRGIFPAA